MKPSRILNDDSLILGLDRNDIMALAITFYFWQVIFMPFGVDYLPLIATIVVAIFLINIRLKYRRKIIRDCLKFYYFKLFRNGVYHDPSES